MISNISVLNSVKDNAADFFVDANGFLNITGCPAVKAKTAKVNTIAIVPPVAGIYTVTFTAVQNYTYNFRVTGYDATNTRVTLTMAYTSPSSGATATTIATAIAARINASPIAAQFASVVGGATLVLTATTANSLINFENFNADPNIVISAVGSGTTLGVEAQGYGADLLLAYGGFVGGSSIVATNYYTQHEITLNPDIITAGQAAYETGLTTYVVLVNASAVTGGSDNVAVNIDLINNATYGTVALLKSGYRAVAPTTAATTVAVSASNVITLSGGAVTLPTLGAQSGDYLVVNSGTAFSTFGSTKIQGVITTLTAVGTTTTVASGLFKYIAVRNIAN
jgi:hypothetical protein